jgi:DNA polymerase elongation subunit (family B)
MSLADDIRDLQKQSAARVLTFDIETQRAIVETFSLFSKFTHMDRVLVPARVLCFSARWRGEDKTIFKAAWNEDSRFHVDQVQYEKILQVIFELLDRAHVVITWNGDRFDLQWIEAECNRLGMGRPSPYKSVDLCKIAKKRFDKGLMSRKLEWSARYWLHDGKVKHGGTDLWHDIRHGTTAEKRAAQKLMREYCVHDTVLTERVFDEYYLPWSPVNLALYNSNIDGELACTKCGTPGELEPAGFYYADAYAYDQYRCRKCKGVSKSARSKHTTPLRKVP